MQINLFRALIAVVAMVWAEGAAGDPTFSNDLAAQVIASAWSTVTLSVPLGKLSVVRNGFGGARNQITVDELRTWYVPLRDAGLLVITEDANRQSFNNGGSFSWNQLLGATTQGIETEISVSLTPLGQQQNVSSNPAILSISKGKRTITKVVSSDAIRKGIDDYRIVRVLYTADWTEFTKKIYQSCGQPVVRNQKAIVLLQYDGFADEWKGVAEDDVNADGDFCTNKVSAVVAR